jgi:hypothetical protein
VLALVVGTAMAAFVGLAVVAVAVAGRAGSTLEALIPAGTVAVAPTVASTAPATTPPPPPELAALRGRPPSPVAAEEAACAPPLVAGRLRPQVPGEWTGRTPGRTTGELADPEARAEVVQVMRRRFVRDDPERAGREALQLYESPRLREITGDVVVLRAALAELKGTLGEPALRFALTSSRPITISFGATQMTEALGQAWGDGHQLSIVIRDDLRHEPGVVVAPIVFHELLHQNGQAQLPEEIVNNVLDIRVAIEMMRELPAAFTRRSDVVDFLRLQTLVQLNTRVGSVLSVDRADVPDVLVDFDGVMPSYGAFLRRGGGEGDQKGEDYYARLADAPSRGHATLVEILRTVAPAAVVPDDMAFDEAAVGLLNTNAGVGLCDQLVAAEVLQAVPRGTAAQRLARTFVSNLAK